MIWRHTRRGSTTVEMTFVGIPLIFTIISIFEISRGMWMYHTLAYAVKEGIRYAVVHGQDCIYAPPNVLNNCAVSAAQVAGVIQNAGVGLDPATTTVVFTAGGTTTCTLAGAGTGCSSTWPPSGSNQIGQTIEIDIYTPFKSALAMFWPGSKPLGFGVAQFSASSSDQIQF